jgi:hypothetical protein
MDVSRLRDSADSRGIHERFLYTRCRSAARRGIFVHALAVADSFVLK